MSGIAWVRTVEPDEEPVTPLEAKQHCRALQDIADEDGLILDYIKGARQMVENQTNRALLTQTWTLVIDQFWGKSIWLPMAAPLQSVSSVKYYDTDGVQQTLSTNVYRVDTFSEPGQIVLKPGQCWPSVQCDRGQSVEITYVCGWTSPDAIPGTLKVATYLLIDHLYENRSHVEIGIGIGAVEIPLGAVSFMNPHTVYWRPPGC